MYAQVFDVDPYQRALILFCEGRADTVTAFAVDTAMTQSTGTRDESTILDTITHTPLFIDNVIIVRR